jgi:protein-S-isoprenylcysteine O-methyltransferase Ste14
MADFVFALGVVAAGLLLSLLFATLVHQPLRIWPTPGPGSWQSYVFWPLFRGLNVMCFASAFVERSYPPVLPLWLRLTAAAALAGACAVFIYAFRKLGRDNSYGAAGGLVTTGIYRWSRNPQNTMLIFVYGGLALASGHIQPALLCASMMLVYAVMVLAEEPWLRAAYGDAYRSYCAEVPRFFNWRRVLATPAGRTRGPG